MLSEPVHMRFNLRIDRRDTWVNAPTVWRPWKPLRLLERLLRFTSDKGRWMISLTVMWWAFFGSRDMLEYEVTKSPMSCRGAALLWGFMDPSRPWGFLDTIYERGSIAGWSTSTGPNGEALVTPKGRYESSSRDLVWVIGQSIWPSIGFKPRLLQTFSRVIKPYGDTSTY